MNNLKQLHWPLILGMGALALIRPLLAMTGALGRPFNPTFLTAVISIAWLAIVTLVGVRRPFLTLVSTGFVYASFITVLSAILSQTLTGQMSGPLTNPISLVAVFITNMLWGAALGVLALGLQRMRTSDAQ